LVQSFPLSLSIAWPAPAAPPGKAWHERSTLHRERLLLVQPAIPPARSLELLVRQAARRTNEVVRRQLVEVLRLRAPAAPRAAAGAGSPKLTMQRAAPVVARACALHPLETPNREPRQAAVPVDYAPPRRPLRLHLLGAGSARPAARPRTPEVRREMPALPASPIPARPHRPARTDAPALPRQAKERQTSRRGLGLTWTARRDAVEPTAPRAGVDLVWTSPSEAATVESRAAAAAAMVHSAAVRGMPQPGSAYSAARAPEAAPPAAPAMPDMNRLVDEVVRRLERLSRDERMRRGI
jgi:hypothetical protein